MLAQCYAKQCTKTEREQVDVVAQFYVHRISAHRIAYRTGIQQSFVEQLILGQTQQRLFKERLKFHRRQRKEQRLAASLRYNGTRRSALQQSIEADFQADR